MLMTFCYALKLVGTVGQNISQLWRRPSANAIQPKP
jgi:hypothetical protein